MPVFADPKVGLVQAPQDHRDGDRSVMHYAMNGEYAGFFDIGMVERNEKNAIIVHGTMCLMRRAALDAAGNWSSDTICEDTDLGLTMLELGWKTHYTNRRYGFGLLPDTFGAFKKQRHRWAYGGSQIIKKHWRRFLPARLGPQPRAEARLPARLADLARRGSAWRRGRDPEPALGAGRRLRRHRDSRQDPDDPDPCRLRGVGRCISRVLYRLRVAIPKKQTFGAVFAAMSLQLTVARAVADGLIKDHLPFSRTAKGDRNRKPLQFHGFWEADPRSLLIIGAIMLVATNTKQIREIYIFAFVLRGAEPAVPVGRGAGAARRPPRQRLRVLDRSARPSWSTALRLQPAIATQAPATIANAIAEVQQASAPVEKQPERCSSASHTMKKKWTATCGPFCFLTRQLQLTQAGSAFSTSRTQ